MAVLWRNIVFSLILNYWEQPIILLHLYAVKRNKIYANILIGTSFVSLLFRLEMGTKKIKIGENKGKYTRDKITTKNAKFHWNSNFDFSTT